MAKRSYVRRRALFLVASAAIGAAITASAGAGHRTATPLWPLPMTFQGALVCCKTIIVGPRRTRR